MNTQQKLVHYWLVPLGLVLAAGACGSQDLTGSIDNNARQQGATSDAVGLLSSAKYTFGAILDFDGLGPHGKQTAATFVNKTGVRPSVIDTYVRMKSDGSFESATANSLVDQAAGSGIAAVCFSVTSEVAGALSDGQLSGLVASINYAKAKQVAVQVRFGYEMNGYWSPSNTTNGVAGDPTNFKAQWAQVAAKVKAAGGLMFWSPNIPFNDSSALARWLPDASTIDLVGIDYYPKEGDRTVAGLRAALNTISPIAVKLNKPLLFGETGIGNTGSSIVENDAEAQTKLAWLNTLVDAQVRKDYPNFQGFRWFDYQKFENNTYNNFSISADSFAAKAFSTWYKQMFASGTQNSSTVPGAVASSGTASVGTTSSAAGDANSIAGNANTIAGNANSIAGNANTVASTSNTGATAGNGTSTFPAVSMDTLLPLAPARLKAVWTNIETAAATYQLQPQLLVAIAMVESTGGADPAAYSNGGGMFQFTDAGTWAAYGHGASRLNDAAEVEPAAHYMSDNLKSSANDLSAALRLYNGPVSQGGASDYQDRIKRIMLGQGF